MASRLRKRIAKKLFRLRNARDLSQTELAEALGVSQTTVSEWESMLYSPSIDNLTKISKFFGLETSYWFQK